MKMLMIVFASLLSFISLSAQADTVKCFHVKKGQTGQIAVSKNGVYVNWDLKEKGSYARESGTPSEVSSKNGVLSVKVFLHGSGDGSDTQISISNKEVVFQSLWMTGEPTGDPMAFKVVACK